MNKKDDLGKLFPGQFIFAIVLTAAAMLLLGAGRLGDSMSSRQVEQGNAHRQWQTAARQLLRRGSAPGRKYHELHKLAVEHPEYLLQTLHTGMQPDHGR